mgnify:CR=1 FL=1
MKLPIFLLLVAILGCGNSTSVNTGSKQPVSVANTSSVRRVNINQTKTFGGLDVTIGEIAIEPGKITVGMTLKNPTKETLTAFPDQGDLLIGSKQLESNLFMATGKLGGEIHAGIEKSGSLAFLDPNNSVDPSTLTSIDLKLGTVYGKSLMKTTDVHWTIGLP